MIDIGADLQRAFDEGYEAGKADRPQGEWITKTVKKFCAPDCWYPGIFAIEGSWNEEEGSWLEEQDGFCSECGKRDEHYYGHKYCPECGSKMKGADDDIR